MPSDAARLIDQITDRVLERLAEESMGPPWGSWGATDVHPPEGDLRLLLDHGACRLACAVKARSLPRDLAATIDHTLLKPDVTESQIRTLCDEARRFGFASVCVNPYWVRTCSGLLLGSGVEVCAVVGFPLGANLTESKADEARRAVDNGATELDMVINVGALKGGDHRHVLEDVHAVVRAADGRACLKVILETVLLSEEEKVAACALAREAGADYVKTSTGFAGGGATVEDVALMRRVVGSRMGVKASGGVKDRQTAEVMIAAGANRIGASAGVRILQGGEGSGGY